MKRLTFYTSNGRLSHFRNSIDQRHHKLHTRPVPQSSNKNGDATNNIDRMFENLIIENSIWGDNQPPTVFREKLTTLVTLMPFLKSKFPRMKPKLIAALADNTSNIARRMIALKDILPPKTDITAVLAERPSLVLDQEYHTVPRSLHKMKRHYSDDDIAEMIMREPLLLVVDIDKVVEDLKWYIVVACLTNETCS